MQQWFHNHRDHLVNRVSTAYFCRVSWSYTNSLVLRRYTWTGETGGRGQKGTSNARKGVGGWGQEVPRYSILGFIFVFLSQGGRSFFSLPSPVCVAAIERRGKLARGFWFTVQVCCSDRFIPTSVLLCTYSCAFTRVKLHLSVRNKRPAVATRRGLLCSSKDCCH